MEQKNKIKSQVSSFMDGEITQDEVSLLCKQMGRDADLCEHWRDYHLISDAMKKRLPEQVKVDLSLSIHDAIANEAEFSIKTSSANMGIVKRFSGFAVAASVAVLGVMAVTNMTMQSNNASVPQLAVNSVEMNATQLATTETLQNKTMDPRLNKYLLDHSEYSVNASLHGVLPYARIVGRPQQVRNNQ